MIFGLFEHMHYLARRIYHYVSFDVFILARYAESNVNTFLLVILHRIVHIGSGLFVMLGDGVLYISTANDQVLLVAVLLRPAIVGVPITALSVCMFHIVHGHIVWAEDRDALVMHIDICVGQLDVIRGEHPREYPHSNIMGNVKITAGVLDPIIGDSYGHFLQKRSIHHERLIPACRMNFIAPLDHKHSLVSIITKLKVCNEGILTNTRLLDRCQPAQSLHWPPIHIIITVQ
mmetsp:Transcript_10592/g.17266  ORF Transcript_10592/g.17266 Transcript_10592/m.17266 type:complete len:232 (+) Transcript_10592:228-923(+)